MLKNKKSIFILLPLVLLIWGGVIYQFFSISSPSEVLEKGSNGFNVKPLQIKEQAPITINVNYRDPFLGKMYTGNTNPTTAKKRSPKTSVKAKVEEVIIWPTILYKGIVSDTKEKNRVFMLIINGQTFLMRKGDIENEVFLKEGDRTSVYVKYKNKLNLILLQE